MTSTSELTLDCAGRRLAARLFVPGDGGATGRGLLFLHGSGSSQAGYRSRAEAAATAVGAVCLTFDLGGHGDSDGRQEELRPCDHLDEAVVAYDRLVAHPGVDPARVGLCGASYGAYLASLLSTRRPVARLLLRAPALYDDADLDVPLGRPRRPRRPGRATALRQALHRFAGEVLVLESGRDEVVGPDAVRAYVEACRRPRHEVIPDAAHALRDPAWDAAFLAAIVRWFEGL